LFRASAQRFTATTRWPPQWTRARSEPNTSQESRCLFKGVRPFSPGITSVGNGAGFGLCRGRVGRVGLIKSRLCTENPSVSSCSHRPLGIFSWPLSAFPFFFLLDSPLSCQWVGKFIHRGRKLSVLIGQFGDWSAIESRFPFSPFARLLRVPVVQHVRHLGLVGSLARTRKIRMCEGEDYNYGT
jgi:hypothetical protein